MAKSCTCTHCGFRHEPKNDKKSSSKLGKRKDNPFTTRGRDKFSVLVSKMEERKQRIIKRSGTDNALMVRFVHSNENKLKPVIIRAKSDIVQKNSIKDALSSGELSAEETAPKKNKDTIQVKLREFKLQRFHVYCLAATVIMTLILLILYIYQ